MKNRRLELVKPPSPEPALSQTPTAPRIGWLAAGLYLFSFLMIAGGILLAPADDPTRWFREKQTMTAYSATLLYTCVLASLLNFLASRRFAYPRLAARSMTPFWGIAMFGFFLLMTDEFFVMHEGIGRFLTYRVLDLPRTPFHDKFDAFLIAFYGLCALAVMGLYRQEFRWIHGFTSLLAIGGIFAGLSLLMDMSPETVRTVYIEEGTKILANTSFLLTCLSATLQNYKELTRDFSAAKIHSPEVPVSSPRHRYANWRAARRQP